MATRETVRQCLVILGAAYPRMALPAQTVTVFCELLSDVDDDLLVTAVKHHAATSKWFPSVAELRSAVVDLSDRAEGVPTAEDAWLEICRKMARYPPVPMQDGWRVPEFSHPLILEAVNVLGGWAALGQSEHGVADRAHFFKIYPQLVARRRADASLLPSVREAIGRLQIPALPAGSEPGSSREGSLLPGQGHGPAAGSTADTGQGHTAATPGPGPTGVAQRAADAAREE